MKRRTFVGMTPAAIAGLYLSGWSGAARSSSNRPLYIDGLSFLPEQDEIGDVAASGMTAYLCDISGHEAIDNGDGTTNYKRTFKACIKSIAEAQEFVETNSSVLIQGLTGNDIELAQETDRCAVFFQIQGADCVEGGFHELDQLYDHGLRVLQLTHHYDNIYAGGAIQNQQKGLTTAGRELVERLNEKRVLIDISHAAVPTAAETIALSDQPIVLSHGAARAIVDNNRCMTDDVIVSLAEKGGVMGIFMMSFWLTNDPIPTVDHYVAHIKHVANIAGVDAAAIANDYPLRGQKNLLALNNNNAEGIKQYLDWWESLNAKGINGFDVTPQHVIIPELNTINRMELIHDALKSSGFGSSDIEKIMGKNLQRVLDEVLV